MENSFIPTFGEQLPSQRYIPRTAAYAFILSAAPSSGAVKLAILKTPNGYYLPGGGVEGKENLEIALKRELIEELGWAIEIKQFFGQARQFLYSNLRQGYYENIGHFFLAEKLSEDLIKTELDHDLEWVTLEEAMDKLQLPFQVWAVKNFLQS